MASTFFILKDAPPDLRGMPADVRQMYFGWVVELGLKRKDAELAAGLNASGGKLPPVKPKTRERRRSAMTPTGKGDPRAPYLQPGRGLSRTRSLLAGKAHADYAEFWWRYDAWTGDQWGRILAIHARRGKAHDVVGLSPKGRAWVAAEALKLWNAWKAGRSARHALPPSGPPAIRPPAIARAGKGYSGTATFGIGAGETEARLAFAEGRAAGGLRSDEWERRFRSARGGLLSAAPGTATSVRTGASNVLLRHVWSRPIPPPQPPPPSSVQPPPSPRRPLAASARPSRPVAPQTIIKPDANVAPDVLEAIRAGLAAIAKVHDVVLPETFAGGAGARMRPTTLGRFRPGSQPGADRIEVRGGLGSTAFTFIHEFGHLVDARGPARHASPGSAPDPAWASWWMAVVETRRMAELLARREGAALEGSAKRTERLDYLLRPREIWARAYAQWIVARSGDNAAGRAFFERLRIDLDYNANWWEDDDFEPVALAIDAVFRKLGWLKS